MEQTQLIGLLAGRQEYLSGEEMSRRLGVSRAAVWKELSAMRAAGWPIASSTRRGYRLEGEPPVLSAPYLEALLVEHSLCNGRIHTFSSLVSTNSRLKAMAAQGAAEGTVVLAEEQTAGRGTQGRTFHSPRGAGLYLSVLLRPQLPLAQLLPLTGWAAVAVGQGIGAACGLNPEIKWLNDLYLNGRKVCGILTELSLVGESGEPDYVVLGVGVNLGQSRQQFAAQGLENIATSLALEGAQVSRHGAAAAILTALEEMYRRFPQDGPAQLEAYRARCLTLGRQVQWEQGGVGYTGTARAVTEDFALEIATASGQVHTVSAGTVSLLPGEVGV